MLSWILAWAAADRFAGGGLGWTWVRECLRNSWLNRRVLRGHLPLRGAYYATLGLLAVDWRVALAWALYRNLPWKWRGHSAHTPSTLRDGMWSLVRHSLPLLPLASLGVKVAFAIPLYGLWATWCAYELTARQGSKPDPNAFIELARGAMFGAVFWTALH